MPRRSGIVLTGKLKDLVEARADGGLLADVRTHLLRKHHAGSDRRMDVIHPSEMAKPDWCLRQTYYRIRDARAGKEIPPEALSAGTLSIFEAGHWAHQRWQTWFREMGRLRGRWHCRECGAAYWPDDPGSCSACNSRTGVVYGEVPLDDSHASMIAGSSDGWVDADRLIEIKTIGKGTLHLDAPELVREHTHKTSSGKQLLDIDGAWQSIVRPLPSHLKQGQIYLHLAEICGLPIKRLTFLYEFKANQQTKEFTIRKSDRILAPLLEKAGIVADAVRAGRPPGRIHDNPEKRPCNTCVWRDECWKGNGAENPQNQRRDAGGTGRPARPQGRGGTRRVVRTRSAR